MAERVINTNEISLNGQRYPISRPVQTVLASIYPPKIVLGDTTRDSQQRASVLAWSNFRGGIGIERFEGAADVDRAWWSTFQLRHKNHMVLPALATLTAVSGVTGTTFSIGAIGELADYIYAAFGTSVRKYSNDADSWGSSLHTLPGLATDVITARVGGTLYLIFAHTAGYSYLEEGESWVNVTISGGVKFLTYWDDKLWGISNAGQLWWSNTIGAQTNDAELQLPPSYVTDLYVARAPDGNPIVKAMTKVGLFVHDMANTRFRETEMALPFHANNGNGSTKWRDSEYIPAGNSIYKFINGSNSAVVTLVGPDRDHGLPSDKRGVITQLVPTHNELLALLDATTTTAVDAYSSGESPVIEPDSGFSIILGWNELGWEIKWLGGSTARAIDYGHVSSVYDKYRLWWAHNERIYFMALPVDIVNPSEVTTFEYAASAEHETPWFNAGQAEIDKLALRLKVECQNMTSSETLTISYGLGYSTTYTQLGVISSDDVTTYEFPNGTTPTGTTFVSIRFKIEGVRGSTTTLSPDMVSLTFEYRKKLPALWGHTVEVDMTNDYGGKTSKELRALLLAAVESTTLVEFTFRDDDGDTRNFYVDIASASGFEQTGTDERGKSTLLLVEV